MRVLLIAPNCAPFNSETNTGYQLARSIGNYVDAVVVTHCFFKDSIEKFGGLGRTSATYIDLEKKVARNAAICKRLGLSAAGISFLNYPLFFEFEQMVWRRFENELKSGQFDIVHRLTPLSSALPSPIASWSQVPFVIGPVNGGLPYPKQFRREMWQERELLRYIRGLGQFLPYVRATFQKASAILASGQHTRDRLPVHDSSKMFHFTEVGFDPNSFRPASDRVTGEQRTFIFVGRLVPFKCVRILISAFGSSPILRRHRLVVVGDGPERPKLEEQVKKLKLENNVEFTGFLSHEGVAARMRSADVFAFPSIREAGGSVIAEAMACGLPCVITDYGGPGDTLPSDCGVKIKLAGPDELISEFRRHLEELAEDPVRRARMSAAAIEEIRHNFTWDAKARMVYEVYRWVLGQRPDKPELFSLWRDAKAACPAVMST